MTKTYTRREADEILRRALTAQPTDGINHEDLVAAAREVGIPSSAIEAAALELGDNQRVAERAALIRRRRRTAFLRHLLLFLVVNAGIFFVDHADGGAYWFQYPLILWGVILAVSGIVQLAPDQRSLTRRAERELEREERRTRKRLRAAERSEKAGSSQHGAREFEAAVQEGVSTLLSAAARTIRGFSEGERYRVGEDARQGAGAPRSSQRGAASTQEQAQGAAEEAVAEEPAAAGPAAARPQRHRD